MNPVAADDHEDVRRPKLLKPSSRDSNSTALEPRAKSKLLSFNQDDEDD